MKDNNFSEEINNLINEYNINPLKFEKKYDEELTITNSLRLRIVRL